MDFAPLMKISFGAIHCTVMPVSFQSQQQRQALAQVLNGYTASMQTAFKNQDFVVQVTPLGAPGDEPERLKLQAYHCGQRACVKPGLQFLHTRDLSAESFLASVHRAIQQLILNEP